MVKKLIKKILKIIWFAFGGLILFWTIFFYIKMRTINNLGVIAVALLFGFGVYALIIFTIITFLYYLIKKIIKWTNKKSSKQEELQKK